MKLIKQSHEVMSIMAGEHTVLLDGHHLSDDYKVALWLERIARTCYRSEQKDAKTGRLVKSLIKSGHDAMLEFVDMTVKFVTNRGVTHEFVRHRMASYAQESTRYVKYDGDMEFIEPVWYGENPAADSMFYGSCEDNEWRYQECLRAGWEAEQAREVLPNAIATTIVVKANLREWRHIFRLRALGTTGRPHPQMKALMMPLLEECQRRVPCVFEDLV